MSNRTPLLGWLSRAGLVMLAFVATSCGDDNPSNPPTTGSIQVSASTTGDELDADGYTVTVDGAGGQSLAVNGTVTFTNQSAGNHQVELTGIAANCTVAGDNPRTVAVTAGNTVSTTFDVTCSATSGGIEVTTVTTGDEIDADGYTVSVDGGADQAIDVNGTLTLTGLDAGDYSLLLGDVAANCTVAGDNPRTVSVTAGSAAQTQFDVSCTSQVGDLNAVNVTSGSNPDDAYTLTIDSGAAQALAANDSLLATGLAAGDHTVELGDVAANCTVAGDNPRTVAVTSGGVVRTQFDVTCTGGTLDVTTETWGTGLDVDDYELVVDGGVPVAIGNDDLLSVPLSVGDHTVELTGIDANCHVMDNPNPRTEAVTDGATTETTFSVFCFSPLSNYIMFETNRDGDRELYGKRVGDPVAQNMTRNAAADGQPEISADGAAVLFESSRAGNFDIWRMNSAGLEQLTTVTAAERDPSWSNDKNVIAYTRGSAIWTMDNGGNNQVALSSGAGDDQPSVSPDGAWVLFRSTRDADGGNIYVVNVASGVETQLTIDPGVDGKPSWWFDGTRILWASDRSGDFEIYVADFVAGLVTIGVPTNLTNAAGGDKMPNMRPNGSGIVFATDRNGTNEVWTMNNDGTGQAPFAASGTNDVDPSWSP